MEVVEVNISNRTTVLSLQRLQYLLLLFDILSYFVYLIIKISMSCNSTETSFTQYILEGRIPGFYKNNQYCQNCDDECS